MRSGDPFGAAEPFVRKLSHGADLTASEERALAGLVMTVRRFDGHQDISSEEQRTRSLPLITEGWACRYRILENGKRQIITLYLPGDLCEPFGVLPRTVDYPIGALTVVTAAFVRIEAIRAEIRASPAIEQALWWDLLAATEIEREHIVSLGRRSAAERLGHLICELQLRLSIVGQASADGFDLLLTQADLADVLGLSTVHINRSLQDLRRAGLISLRSRRLTIHDLEELREMSMFDAGRLHPPGLMLRATDAGSQLEQS